MWMFKWMLLILCVVGDIHAQDITMHFNYSLENININDQLYINCNVKYMERFSNLYIKGNDELVNICINDLGSTNNHYSYYCMNTSSDLTFNLTINRTGRDDDGTLVCQVEGLNETLPVIVKYPPTINTITKEPDDEEIKEGSDVKVSCLVDSIPQSNITWTLHDKLYHNHNKTLLIKNVSCKDTGKYIVECKANNGIGVHASKEQFDVLCPPRINSKQTPQLQIIASLSDSVTLTATVRAYPYPNFTWKHLLEDMTEIDITDFRMRTKSDNLTSYLDITNVQEHDYGKYIMYAKNKINTISVTFTLKMADDNELGTGIGIGFFVGLIVMGVVLAIAVVIWKKRNTGANLRQFFLFKKNPSEPTCSEDTESTPRKPTTALTTATKYTNRPDQTYEGLDTKQPTVDQTYEGLLPGSPVKTPYEEQEIYENQ